MPHRQMRTPLGKNSDGRCRERSRRYRQRDTRIPRLESPAPAWGGPLLPAGTPALSSTPSLDIPVGSPPHWAPAPTPAEQAAARRDRTPRPESAARPAASITRWMIIFFWMFADSTFNVYAFSTH